MENLIRKVTEKFKRIAEEKRINEMLQSNSDACQRRVHQDLIVSENFNIGEILSIRPITEGERDCRK